MQTVLHRLGDISRYRILLRMGDTKRATNASASVVHTESHAGVCDEMQHQKRQSERMEISVYQNRRRTTTEHSQTMADLESRCQTAFVLLLSRRKPQLPLRRECKNDESQSERGKRLPCPHRRFRS